MYGIGMMQGLVYWDGDDVTEGWGFMYCDGMM